MILKSYEDFILLESDYYVYSPSKTAQEMFFYPLQCGHFIYEPGYSLRRKSYDSFLLMYIQKGGLALELEERTFFVPEGHFVLLDCYQSHAYSTDTGCDCLWCHFDGITARSWYSNLTSHLGNAFSPADPYPALNKLAAIYNIFRSGSRVQEPLISKYFTDILTSFLLDAHKKQNICNYANMAEGIITYINEHFAEDIPVGQLAKQAGLSLYHFIRIFKKETGFTPHEYIVNTRLATAKYLLKNTKMPIKDICFNTGFSCESVFCSAFKHRLGMTPAQYRGAEKH